MFTMVYIADCDAVFWLSLYTFFGSINKSEYSFLLLLVLPVGDFSRGNTVKPLLDAEHNVMLRALYCRLSESKETGWCCKFRGLQTEKGIIS